uniref:Uncharacterized protein n=1 Tax=Arundo donax TaxID=35708 RepID=A0A0A8YA21_ARUDO
MAIYLSVEEEANMSASVGLHCRSSTLSECPTNELTSMLQLLKSVPTSECTYCSRQKQVFQ